MMPTQSSGATMGASLVVSVTMALSAAAVARIGGRVLVGVGSGGVVAVADAVGGTVAVGGTGVRVMTTSATLVTSTTWVITMGSLWHAAANTMMALSEFVGCG
ncbi:MAG: hypothetical protein V9G20_17025 [Candidatus Promineifilaceae bacterium]